MAIQDGKIYFVTGEGFTYAAQLSGSFDADANMIEITSKDSSGFREYIAGLKGGTVSFDGLNDWADSDGFNRIAVQFLAGTQVTWTMGQLPNSTGVMLHGEGFFESISLTAPNDEAVGYSGSLRISGAISQGATS
jgi:predicted secreted protein